MTRTLLGLSLVFAAACGRGIDARGTTCAAYEAAAEPARAVCHRACDLIPAECPWSGEGDSGQETTP